MAAAAGDAEAPLCAYELERLERIKRNRKARSLASSRAARSRADSLRWRNRALRPPRASLGRR
jgi:hypothetical protein